MKKNILKLYILLLIIILFPKNISFGISQTEKYLDIKITRPLVQKNLINLESQDGFVLFEENDIEDILFFLEDTNIKITLGTDRYIDILNEENNVIFTLPKDGSILVSSSDIDNSLIKIEKDRYRDYLKFINKNNEILVINHVNIENYLYGVVPREMGYTFPLEALKAQAVASRSFALSSSKHKSDGYDLCDTTDCQVYSGFDGEHPYTNQAVDETSGILAIYEGEAIQAMYHSTSSGMTEDSVNAWGGNLPYLKSVIDIYSTDSPYSSWKVSFSLTDLNEKLQSSGVNVGELRDIQIVETTASGNVKKVKITGSQGEEIITGSRLRTILGGVTLKSTWFTINGGNNETSSRNVYVIDGNTYRTQIIDLYESYILDGKKLDKPNRSSSRRIASKDRQKDLEVLIPTSSSELIIEGRGYGHGVGMSQNGAKKMAELGYTFEEILRYYYTGIEVY